MPPCFSGELFTGQGGTQTLCDATPALRQPLGAREESSAASMAQASERIELTAVRRGPDLRQSRRREKAMLAESRRLWWLVSGDVEVTAAGLSA